MSELRDPQTDAERVVKEETLVLLGVCTLTLTLTNPTPNPNPPPNLTLTLTLTLP